MKFKAIFIFGLTCWLAAIANVARADLAEDVRAVLRDKYLAKAQVGIAIARLPDAPTTNATTTTISTPTTQPAEILFRHESDAPFMPASNLKLVTTSAFLDRFGPDFKFRTVLLMKDADLFVIGDGDPTLGDAEMLKKLGWDVDTVFKAWADALKQRGVTSVRNVYVDDSVFDEVFLHPNWLSRYLGDRYAAQVGGVNLNANCIDFLVRATSPGEPVAYTMNPDTRYANVRNLAITGEDKGVGVSRPPNKNDLTLRGEIAQSLGKPISVPIQDPPMFAATVLAEALGKNGVAVTGTTTRDRGVRERYSADPSGWSVAAALDTKIETVLERANKDSMNLYAEAMCKRLGHEVSGQPGSWANGTAAVGDFLKRIGVEDHQFHLDDGSGLSRENAISAGAILKILSHNFQSRNREAFVSSLAVGGADGTFEKRFKNNLRGRVFGKSGYINGVSCLSGYVKTESGQWYAFSILMNGITDNGTAKTLQERIVSAIDENATK
jgi:D-alanyl-D-alanine carboxypeptidase/D-alanyl-D-alanine-endopeptidase (penicillin-binding protein 4)